MHKIFLKPGKDEPVRRFHPWVFSGAIGRVEGAPADGDLVAVHDRQGDLLGVGHFHDGSIAVRLLGFGEVHPEEPAFWIAKIRTALSVRRAAGLPSDVSHTNCYRLLHGEGDGVSGLIADIYGTTAVVQCHSIGMHRQRTLLAEALRTVFGSNLTAIYDKSSETLPPQYAAGQQNSYLWTAPDAPPPTGTALVEENGVRFQIDWEKGQKTGFFLDQRDNRALLQDYAAGKSVLNAFCYTGGFSAYALRAGAHVVHSVDVSAKAMQLTEENMALNAPFAGTHTGFTADVMAFLKNSEQQYEVLIIDPPAFAKSLDKRHNAVKAYIRLNAAAIQRAAPGAVLFTFSCSQVIGRELFYNSVVAAAVEAGRPVRVLHHLTQGADHPVSLFHPEGAYLKGLVLYIE